MLHRFLHMTVLGLTILPAIARAEPPVFGTLTHPAQGEGLSYQAPEGFGERLTVHGQRTLGYHDIPATGLVAPVPHASLRAYTIKGFGSVKFQLGGSGIDHDPTTGTNLRPFGEAYMESNPMLPR